MKEKEIIQACRKKKEKGFRAIVDQYAPSLMGVCMRYSKSSEDAKDYLQDALIHIFKNFDKFNEKGPLGAWMRRLTINVCLKKLRIKNVPLESVHDWTTIEHAHEDMTESVIDRMQEEELLKTIKMLPQEYFVIFNLYVVEEYNHSEIAEMLSISENTSRVKLMRARQRLKEILVKKNYYGVEKFA